MSNRNQLLNEINGAPFKIQNMVIGKKYKVINIEKTYTNFGQRIVVKCEDITITLPESWTERMSNNNIKTLLEGESPLYIVYNGKIALPNDKFKHDLKFVE